jgi:hypothetical protein
MAALAVAGCRVRDHALGVPARDKVTRR